MWARSDGGRHAAPYVESGPRLWRTWTPGAARTIAIVLLGCLALVAWWWWQGRPRPVEEIPTTSVSADAPGQISVDASIDSATTTMLTVHVIGRVRQPGIVELPEGARVADAIAAAGGLRDERLRSDLNLARLVVDGEQIDVRRRAAKASTTSVSGSSPTPGPINLNTADAAALQSLPGIGPVLAGRIVAWRDANGPFPNIDVLGEVSGIGPALMAELRPLVRV